MTRTRGTACGSLGYTLSVPASQAVLARAVLRADPTLVATVTVIDQATLDQIMAPRAQRTP